MNRIYLDYAAQTPLDPQVRACMEPWIGRAANPGSVHAEGRAARTAIDTARTRLAAVWGRRPRDLIFTATGSEAVATALLGYAQTRPRPGVLITSPAEHRAVLGCVAVLEARGWRIVRLPVDAAGRPDPATLEQSLRTVQAGDALISLMLVNNETGAVTDYAAVAALAAEHRAFLHCDAASAGYGSGLDVVLRHAGAVTLAAHKCGGPVAGVVLLADRTAVSALIPGGAQEGGLRAGTEVPALITGAAEAFVLREERRSAYMEHACGLQARFEQLLKGAMPQGAMRVTMTATGERSPALTHVVFSGLDRDALIAGLDLAGLAASSGSACAAGALERSHVVDALGMDEAWSAPLRTSWGPQTTAGEIEEAAGRIIEVIRRLREVHAASR